MIDVDFLSQSFFTVKEIQELLRIGQVAAYRLVRSPGFPVIRVGKTYRIPASDFYSWIKTQYPKTAETILIPDTTCILGQIKANSRRRFIA